MDDKMTIDDWKQEITNYEKALSYMTDEDAEIINELLSDAKLELYKLKNNAK